MAVIAGIGPELPKCRHPLGAGRGADPPFRDVDEAVAVARDLDGIRTARVLLGADRRGRFVGDHQPPVEDRRSLQRRPVLAVGDGDDEPRAIIGERRSEGRRGLSVATAVQVEPPRAPESCVRLRPALDDRVEVMKAARVLPGRAGARIGSGDDAGRVDRRRRRRRLANAGKHEEREAGGEEKHLPRVSPSRYRSPRVQTPESNVSRESQRSSWSRGRPPGRQCTSFHA